MNGNMLYLICRRTTNTNDYNERQQQKKYNTIIINHENWLSKCLTWSRRKTIPRCVCVCVTDNNSYFSSKRSFVYNLMS